MIDYKELLAKYILHVSGQSDYEYGYPVGPQLATWQRNSGWTDEEWSELRQLAGLPPTDPPPMPPAPSDPNLEVAEFKSRLRDGTRRFMLFEKGRI